MKPRQNPTPVSIEEVAASIQRITAMPQAEKETLCEDIFKQQPNLLAHVLALSTLNVPIEKVDKVLDVLLVLYDVFTKATPAGLSIVSEEMLESCDQNQQALLRLMDSEEPSEARRLCQLATKSHPEINAFAYANGTLHEAGINDSRNEADVYCIRAVRNLVDALARARRE